MRIFLVSLLLSLSTALWAQNDKIFLKNGSVIRGTVLRAAPADTLLIDIRDHLVPVPLAVVDEIRFRKRGEVRPERYNDLVYRSGFATAIEPGILIGNHSSTDSLKLRPTLELSQEYHYRPLLNVGISGGIHYYHTYLIFPVAINYHALLGKRHKSWLLYGKVGYGFAQSRMEREAIDATGGLLFQTGIGWQQRIGENLFRIKLGYSSQTIEEKQDTGASTFFITRERRMNRVMMQVAYVFSY